MVAISRTIEKRVRKHLRGLKNKKIALLDTKGSGFSLVRHLLQVDYDLIKIPDNKYDVVIVPLEIDCLAKDFFDDIFQGKLPKPLNLNYRYPLKGVTTDECILYCKENNLNFESNSEKSEFIERLKKLDSKLLYSVGSTIENLSDIFNR